MPLLLALITQGNPVVEQGMKVKWRNKADAVSGRHHHIMIMFPIAGGVDGMAARSSKQQSLLGRISGTGFKSGVKGVIYMHEKLGIWCFWKKVSGFLHD